MFMVPFEEHHMTWIQEQEAMQYLAPFRTPDVLRAFACSPFAFTGLDDDTGRALICAGVVLVYPELPLEDNVGEAWAVIDADVKPQFRAIFNAMQRFLDDVPICRVQAVVRRSFLQAHRLVRMLGFVEEAPLMRAYHPGGIDCSLYARVKG